MVKQANHQTCGYLDDAQTVHTSRVIHRSHRRGVSSHREDRNTKIEYHLDSIFAYAFYINDQNYGALVNFVLLAGVLSF